MSRLSTTGNSVQMIIPAEVALHTADDHDASVTFVLKGQDLKSSERIREDSSLDLPEIFRISHTTSQQNKLITDRHLVQFSMRKRDSLTGNEGTAVVNLTIAVPRNGVFDVDDVIHLCQHVYSIIGYADTGETNSYVRALLRGQV